MTMVKLTKKYSTADVKEHANFSAESNNDNGVYNIIHKYAVSL